MAQKVFRKKCPCGGKLTGWKCDGCGRDFKSKAGHSAARGAPGKNRTPVGG